MIIIKIAPMQTLKKYPIVFFILFIGIYLGLKFLFWPMQKNIDVSILKSDSSITHLLSPARIIDRKQFKFNLLTFPHGEELFHQNTGFLGYRENFFIHAKTAINVLKAGHYTFVVKSDDGFSLKVNNKALCEHIDGRSLENSYCEIYLEKGRQLLELRYYQGFGHLGLEVSYEPESEKNFILGTDSEYFTFHLPNQSEF